jgi:hypothetical protein
VRTRYDPGSVLGRHLGLYLYGMALPLMIERVLLDSTGDQAVSFRERAKCLYAGLKNSCCWQKPIDFTHVGKPTLGRSPASVRSIGFSLLFFILFFVTQLIKLYRAIVCFFCLFGTITYYKDLPYVWRFSPMLFPDVS